MTDESTLLLDEQSRSRQQQSPYPTAPSSPALLHKLRAPVTACVAALLLGLSLAALSRLASVVSGTLSSRETLVGRRWRRPFNRGHQLACHSKDFVKHTLVLLAEYRAARLLGDSPDGALRKYELSDVVGAPAHVSSGAESHPPLYVVLDNSFRILKVAGRVDDTPGTPHELLKWPGDDGSDSGFEGIAYSPRTNSFAVVQEEVIGKSARRHAHIFEVNFTATSNEPDVLARCDTDVSFEHANKGFEGAIYAVGVDGEEYLLGLCEGNFCSGGTKGATPGNGRIILLKRIKDSSGNCVYKEVTVIKLPPSVDFVDYSAIDLYQGPGSVAKDGSMTVAVTSQQSAALWISTITPVPEKDGYFMFDDGKIFDFPVNDQCEVVYCNIEGVHFLNRHTIVAVSDKMKSRGRQNFRCSAKDQSVHLFAIP